MIKISNLAFDYPEGEFRLEVPDLCISEGEAVAIIGPSGTGKTTLLNLVAGILTPGRGRIEVDGTVVSDLGDSARRSHRIANAGLVFQEFELLEYLTVLENILLPYRITRTLKLDTDTRARARELAEHVGIADKLGRFPRKLSQGERQRVALCRALLVQPSIILADEPTGNLDPSNRDRVLEIVFDYVRSNRATLMTVTHEHELLDRFDRVIDMTELSGPDDATEAQAQ